LIIGAQLAWQEAVVARWFAKRFSFGGFLMILNSQLSRSVLWLCSTVLLLFAFQLAALGETLTLTKNGPKTAREGDVIEYLLEVVNEGTVNLDGVVVFDALPAQVEFIEAESTPSGLYEPATGLWTLPSLGIGEDDRVASLQLQALVSSDLLADPSDVVPVLNQARVATPQTTEPIEAEVATSIVCPFCIDWEILSASLASDVRVDIDRQNTELRFDLHVQVINNGPIASQGTVTAVDFSVLHGNFHPTLVLSPALPVAIALAPGETQTITFGTNWSDWPDTDYTIAWEFEVADTSLMDPVMPNTVSGSYTGEGYDNDSGGGGCFIATAAYGSYLDPHVRSLRRFRDETLMRSGPGRALVGWYYDVSPPIAQYIQKHETFRTLTRMALAPVVFTIEAPAAAFSVLIGLPFLTFVLRRWLRLPRG
jgi:uncharacterized repeat protein (TIGR01451 family)